MARASSQVEKHFQMHSVYRRSRDYFDVEKINEIEHYEQIYRRKPTKSIGSLDTRVDSSFLNSVDIANQRINRDISEFKKRYQDDDETDTNLTAYTQRSRAKIKVRVPDISKMTGRKQSISSMLPPYNSQDQFNNFTLISPKSKNKSVNFTLLSPRSKSTLTNPNQPTSMTMTINPERKDCLEVGKIDEKTKFSESIYKCLFDYSKMDKYQNSSRQDKSLCKQIVPIPHERIQKSEKASQVNRSPNLFAFYHSIGKDCPSQMNMKVDKNNEYYYESQCVRKSKEDFGTRKRKEQMILKRLEEILKKKNSSDCREEGCDEKYFRRRKNQN